MNIVISKDGTKIAYDKTGSGPALIMVAGAFSYRKYPGKMQLAELLSKHFTVYNYDRRGRGDSTDTKPYIIEKEIEDLKALIAEAGGKAYVWGLSSGAALALQAASAGLPITKLAIHEAPFSVTPEDRKPPAEAVEHLNKLIAQDNRGEAVTYFMKDMMGAPGFVIVLMHIFPGVWKKLTAVAHTLPYDAALIAAYTKGKPLSKSEWERVTMPTIIMAGSESPAFLLHAAEELKRVLPNAELCIKKGLGHTKSLSVKIIAPVLINFFTKDKAIEKERSN